jgi:hypothetical protein
MECGKIRTSKKTGPWPKERRRNTFLLTISAYAEEKIIESINPIGQIAEI